MKRKIEDYKNKFVAIFCSSIEKWNKVNDLLGKKGLTQSYGDINKPDNTFVDCIHINGMGTGSKKYYEQQTYVIYPASDFLEEEPEFEVGKWYKYNNHIGKFAGEKDGLFTVSEYIHNNKFNDVKDYHNKWGKIDDYQKILLEDLSEIQEWLPEGHVDKIKSPILFKFNINDEVKVKSGGCYISSPEDWVKESHESAFPSERYGTFGKIADRKHCQNLNWYKPFNGGNWITEDGLELVKTEIIPEYVEYIDTKYKGKIVKVEDWCCGSYCKVIFYNGIKEQPFKHLVKPSTRAEYEAQNKPKQLNVKDLIKGEIYVFDINSTKNFISKFDYSDSYNYYDTCFIQGNEFYNEPESATISDINNIRFANNEEKKWLNTCISQDKFIPKEDLHLYDDSGLLIKKEEITETKKTTIMKFKPGDKVEFIDSSSKNAKYFKKGLTNLEIRKEDFGSYFVYESDKSTSWNVEEHELRLVSSLETTSLTWQELLTYDGYEVDYNINGTKGKGKITVEQRDIYVCQDYKDGSRCKDKKGFKYSWILCNNKYESHYYKNIIEKVYSSTTTIPIDIYKKDDYIYVLGGETTTCRNCKDKVVKIQNISSIGSRNYAKTDYSKCGGIWYNEFRKATQNEIDTLYIHKKTEEEKWIPKENDWVIITKSPFNWSDTGMTLFDGKCFQIEKTLEGKSTKFKNAYDEMHKYTWNYSENHFRKALSHEIPKEESLEEEVMESSSSSSLLNIAKAKYPRGTYYISASCGSKQEVKGEFKYLSKGISDGWGGFVYYDGKWAKIVSSDYSEQKISNSGNLEEAKKRYPIGTKFISPENGKQYTVYLYQTLEKSYYLASDKKNVLATISNGSGEYLFYNGKWAEILLSTEEISMSDILEEVKKKYPIGTIFDSLGGNSNVKVTHSTNFYINDEQINGSNFEKHSTAVLYRKNNNKWAKILSHPYDVSIDESATLIPKKQKITLVPLTLPKTVKVFDREEGFY